MKVALLITGSGPLVIVTSHASFIDPALIEKLRAKGIEKFIAYEVPLATARQRYEEARLLYRQVGDVRGEVAAGGHSVVSPSELLRFYAEGQPSPSRARPQNPRRADSLIVWSSGGTAPRDCQASSEIRVMALE